jgi:uncharacterized membrane protein
MATDADCVLEPVPARGDFVPRGAPLFRVVGDPGALDRDEVARLVVGNERSHTEDPAYGFRRLVDVAERSISAPFNDPTTALEALDRLHDLLRQLIARPFPSIRHTDDQGRLRLLVPNLDWDGYFRLAFDEIRIAGTPSPQVTRRLAAALTDLASVAPPERRPALNRRLRLLSAAVHRCYEDAGASVPVTVSLHRASRLTGEIGKGER